MPTGDMHNSFTTHTHTHYFKLVKGHKHFSNTLCYFSSLFCQQDMDWNGLHSCHSSLIPFKTINKTFCTIDSAALIVQVSVGATQGLTRVYNLTSYEAALNCKLLDIASRLYPESCRRVNPLFYLFLSAALAFLNNTIPSSFMLISHFIRKTWLTGS